MSIGSNCWNKNIGVNWKEHRLIHNLYMGQRKLCLNQGEMTVWRLEEESDRAVAYHPYYLTIWRIFNEGSIS
jgi:hypothetical protein